METKNKPDRSPRGPAANQMDQPYGWSILFLDSRKIAIGLLISAYYIPNQCSLIFLKKSFVIG